MVDHNWHIIMRQPANFHRNRSTHGGVMTSHHFFAKKISNGPKFADPSMSAYNPVNLGDLRDYFKCRPKCTTTLPLSNRYLLKFKRSKFKSRTQNAEIVIGRNSNRPTDHNIPAPG